ncbi:MULTISPECIES: prepilin peptidase [Rhodanobacter]|uniref:prepilin peptidase n=1 Tax=Rhodanobacter TaxID=75309 RepID=UPI000406D97B|nr:MULTISPECIES: A24 family peptidase [Rhodanobacter]KZC20571.1 methyltransferase [Rhodanobacter denitrificans]UJJ51964.1 A24 family peptidase [Rhodanobacter denitrificans]UJJ59258.1 A24 family peptidase [Rhodanobacter denitrificans]UJM94708.1 A24 family peptidase [Rhodanobacter denitrificans]UJM98238.1 A24 family peptidase [Rhodanobacter denitrificans]
MPELPLALWIALAGVLGLLVGSFLNVVILRLPARMAAAWRQEAWDVLELQADAVPLPPGIVREPSHCPHCKHPLSALDNIPLLGWLLLRGRCRYCRAEISIQYPLVELLSGVLSAVIVWKFGPSWAALAGLALTWTLIALSGIDFRTQLLPDQLTLPLLWLGLLLSLLPMFVTAPASILAAAIGYLSLWSVYWAFKLLTGKEGMGHGDFKLLAALGAWMGPVALLPVILLSSLIGALVGGTLIALRKHEREIPMPFGPFIAAAGWVWFVAGADLLQGYMQLTGLR